MRHSPILEEDFPHLAAVGYNVTSEPANPPTCIGYALGDCNFIWDANGAAIRFPGYTWLPNGPFDFEIDTVARIFELHGYLDCAMDAGHDVGFEKVAIYQDDKDLEEPFSHVARQLPNGKWTSKLGGDEDIEHDTPHALEGDTYQYPRAYGRIVKIMKRIRR